MPTVFFSVQITNAVRYNTLYVYFPSSIRQIVHLITRLITELKEPFDSCNL